MENPDQTAPKNAAPENTPDDGENLVFPLRCPVSVVFLGNDEVEARVRAVLKTFYVVDGPAPGNATASGRLRTLRAELLVPSLPELRRIDADLKAVEGVRMVL